MAKIVISYPPGSDNSYDLPEEAVSIGRQPDNMIQIEDASVSSHHAELTPSDLGYLLKDLGSANGTRVGGKEVTEVILRDGDRVRFGKIEATFFSEMAGEAIPLPEETRVEIRPAEASMKPSNFANASPFKTKGKKKDSTGTGVMAFAVLSMLVFLGAVASILALKPQ